MFDSDLGANENSVVRRRAFLPRKASTNWFRGQVSVVPEYLPPDSDRRGRVNRTAALRGIGPKDELEAMLAATNGHNTYPSHALCGKHLSGTIP